METMIKIWRVTLFLWPTIILLTFFLTILFFFPNKRYGNIPLSVKLYPLTFCIGLLIINVTTILTNEHSKLLNACVDYLITTIEFLLINYYFYSLNQNTKQKRVLKYLTGLFLLIAIILAFQLPTQHAVVRLYTTQVFLLLLPTFFYFKTLFKTNSVMNITNTPAFWISTGIAFFLLCTMILSVIETFFLNHRPDILAKLYPTYYIFYIIMFLMFLKAYLCRPVENNNFTSF